MTTIPPETPDTRVALTIWEAAATNAHGGNAPKTPLLVAAQLIEAGDKLAELLKQTASGQFTDADAREQGIEHVLAAVAGTVFRSDAGEVIILLRDDPYVISVDEDGDTASAYLVTVTPGEIARAMDADEAEISGWSTGWDC
jgi:hypothetical protein